MAKAFPKTLFVTTESDKDSSWFLADGDAAGLVAMGSKIRVATYQLVEIREAEGVAQFKPSRSR